MVFLRLNFGDEEVLEDEGGQVDEGHDEQGRGPKVSGHEVVGEEVAEHLPQG